MIPLKKDSLGMYSDLQINPYEDFKKYTLDELKDIGKELSVLMTAPEMFIIVK